VSRTFLNPFAGAGHPGAAAFDGSKAASLRALFAQAPGFRETPLIRLDKIARHLGVSELWAKDERNRWGQGSFKALGGAYAVVALAAEQMRTTPATIFAGRAPKASGLTVATATAGNHGRAVAFGAKRAGARAVIFVYGDVPKAHADAIAALGAELVKVPGDYEAACRAAEEAAARNRWTVVSDVARDGYTEIPQKIMQGYSVLAAEAAEQAPHPFTHIVLQAGVGGLATPTAAYFANTASPKPVTVVVEAATVPCLQESARRNRFTRTAPMGATNLNRLDCPTPSSTTWPILRALAEGFVGVDNDVADEAVALLQSEEGIATTPTGAAGLAGLLTLKQEPAFAALGFARDSRVMIVLSEQAIAA
jgi:diaminopropionate ammonia-lyase